jgi:glycosyltransferase involved in cell wall biosynthesis
MEPIDIILPAHNEGDAIGDTLREFYQVVFNRYQIPIRFIVCEDGSTDKTVEVVEDLAREIPLLLISSPVRKGYSRAVIDGLRASTSETVGFIDSDGQCDPEDFARIHESFHKTGCDLLIGYRNPRRDHWIRLVMSSLFKLMYHLYFRPGLRDPSCPYLMIKRPALERILSGKVGVLKQGFWWEFAARAAALKLSIQQEPVTHRIRSAGETQVYKPAKVPRIAWEHLRGLSRLKAELADLKSDESVQRRAGG